MLSNLSMRIPLIQGLLGLALLFTAACNAFLDDPRPTDSLPVDAVFQTADDLDAALIGVYDVLQDGHLYGRGLIVFPDLMGGNADSRGLSYSGLDRYSSLNFHATDWYAENTWGYAYKAINQINAILAALPAVKASDAALTASRADQIRGEALLWRGMLHFELLRLFALPYDADKAHPLGVPYLQEPVLKVADISYPTRISVDSVYVFVKRDIELARTLLPDQVASGRAGKYAALAFLARVAFQQRDYQQAAAYTREILKGPFSLSDTPQDVVDQDRNDEESILTLIYRPDEPGSRELHFVYKDAAVTASLIRNGYEQIVTPGQLTKVQADGYGIVDLRTDPGVLSRYPFLSIDTAGCRKYSFEQAGFHRRLDVSLARLPEFMLMQAEALAWLNGPNQESVDLLNLVRLRALRVIDAGNNEVPGSSGYIAFALTDFGSGDALIETIIRERRVELAFEGNYFFDLLRLKHPVRGFPYDTCWLRLPIPQRERDVNKNLVQNPCY